MIQSDHKPIIACFTTQTRIIHTPLLQEKISDIKKQLDILEKDSKPMLLLQENACFFGSIKINVPKTRTIRFQNMGKVIARYQLVPKSKHEPVMMPWYHIEPREHSILPGDFQTIHITIHVEPKHTMELNHGTSVEDVVVFHVEHGQDFFISLAGDWTPSILGESMDMLCFLKKPIVSYTTNQLKQMYNELKKNSLNPVPDNSRNPLNIVSDHSSLTLPIKSSVPTQIWTLMEFITTHGTDQEHLFTKKGSRHVIEYLLDCLDQQHEINPTLLFAQAFQGSESAMKMDLMKPNLFKESNTTLSRLDPVPFETDTTISRLDQVSFTETNTIVPVQESKQENEKSTTPVDVLVQRGKEIALSSACQLLKTLLQSLPEPIIPHIMVESLLMTPPHQVKSMIQTIPRKEFFLLLIGFINQMKQKNPFVVVLMTPILLDITKVQSTESYWGWGKESVNINQKRAQFLSCFFE
jgi:hypothetical protein